MSGEQKPSDLKRHLYIDEAMAYAYKHNEWCAPCVWWVCDHSGNEKGRHILALFDALTAAQAALKSVTEERDANREALARLATAPQPEKPKCDECGEPEGSDAGCVKCWRKKPSPKAPGRGK